MPDPRPFLIVAASARALAASARKGGYKAAALDYFCDTDLADVTTARERVAQDAGGGFDADALVSAVERLAPAGSKPAWGLVYGSGFEDRPGLLERLASGRRLFGNSPDVLARAKDPGRLAALLDGLGVPHPETRLKPPAPEQTHAWLVKRRGGAGGIHIREARRSPEGAEAGGSGSLYYQRRVAGRAVSALVIGSGAAARVLGFSAQWTCPRPPDQPFRFGGAVAPVPLPDPLRRKLAEAAVRVAEELSLVGVNGVDFIVGETGRGFSMIEVNPRPGATVVVFDHGGPASLFDLHVRAAAGALPALAPTGWFPPETAFASAILYAEEETIIAGAFDWPEWTADRPAAAARIGPGQPICTVFAESREAAPQARGRTPAERARRLALCRTEALRGTIRRCMQSVPA